ncbi:enoyl-CoA hydratase/isomerase family protein [Hugenholtzia roseola]|uniref:enoyl-CoA hydratase/isomerase family protein n=1 Tax=Hugenholtzia roseola TaxID=1002 RepID=UPI0003FF2356|nr:enoyl-CoA hydratase/isomerase family protein [Hugenholtzia roseola]
MATLTSYTDFPTLEAQVKGEVLHLQLNRGTSNPINSQMIADLKTAFEQAAQDEAIAGVILKGKEKFFSSGLDLKEIYDFDAAQIKQFWLDFIQMVRVLAKFPKPFVVAVTGHSPAGGCVLSICADYRIMSEGDFIIGLNEIPVGIVVPELIFDLYAFWIGNRLAYQYLLEGKLVAAADAKAIHLVDEVVPFAKMEAAAQEKMEDYLNFDPKTWQISKQNLRSQMIEKLEQTDLETVLAPMLAQWWSPRTRAILKAVVDSLSKKAK